MAPSRPREVLVATWHRWVDGPFFMGWLYLLLAAGVLAAAAWRRRTAAAALSASGLAMVAPLVPLATAADFRYLLWLVVASLVAFVLLVSPAPRAGR
jgi:peptidoglycan/LPS O-acetylase OafA/YrhL